MNTLRRILLFSAIAIIIGLAIGINALIEKKAEKDTATIAEGKSESIIIPDIIDTDIFGVKRRASDFRGNYIYVQFIKKDGLQNIPSIEGILEDYKKRDDFKVILITEINEDINKYFLSQYEEFIINKDYARYVKMFEAPECCESILLYDKNGKLVQSSYYYGNNEVIRTILARNIDNKLFDIKKYISINGLDYRNNIIEPIREYLIQSNNSYYLIHLSTRICSSCKSGAIIEKIDSLYKELGNHPITFVLLLKNHSDKDIDILKKHFNIQYGVFSVKNETDLLWQELVNEYGNGYLTDIVVVMDRNGNVLRVLEPKCNCDNEFFSRIKDEIKNENIRK